MVEFGKEVQVLVDNLAIIPQPDIAKSVYILCCLPLFLKRGYATIADSANTYIGGTEIANRMMSSITSACRGLAKRLKLSSGEIDPEDFPPIDIAHCDYPDEEITGPAACFICPITKKPIRFPVVAWDKKTGNPCIFERKAIVQWLREHRTNPFTGEPLNLSDLKEHLPYKREIERLLSSRT